MQSDPRHDQQNLNLAQRVRALSQRAARTQALRDRVADELVTRTEEIESLSAKIDVLVKVGELFRALMDRLVLSHVRSVEAVVTDGLRSIFFDQTLSFEAEVAQRYNRICVDFFIRQERGEGKFIVRGNPLDSFGGGPSSIASLVLRLLVLLKLKRWPLLLLDETLSPISPDYVEGTSLFFKRLSTSLGIPTLLVTHKHEFIEHSTLSYTASEKVSADQPHLEVQKVRG